jgi:hypothetical protein
MRWLVSGPWCAAARVWPIKSEQESAKRRRQQAGLRRFAARRLVCV